LCEVLLPRYSAWTAKKVAQNWDSNCWEAMLSHLPNFLACKNFLRTWRKDLVCKIRRVICKKRNLICKIRKQFAAICANYHPFASNLRQFVRIALRIVANCCKLSIHGIFRKKSRISKVG
jgi:hypothetical protein